MLFGWSELGIRRVIVRQPTFNPPSLIAIRFLRGFGNRGFSGLLNASSETSLLRNCVLTPVPSRSEGDDFLVDCGCGNFAAMQSF